MRTSRPAILFILVIASQQMACGQSESERMQIAEATAALPPAMRDSAAVLGYRGNSMKLETLRKGLNEMICLADKPGDETFHVACYHKSLEPFMARGRVLRNEGKERPDIMRTRLEEIEAGTLEFPDHPAALYSKTGGSLNRETGEIEGASGLHVIYIPYATPEETGLTTDPAAGGPWLMFPGMPWAHVMISDQQP